MAKYFFLTLLFLFSSNESFAQCAIAGKSLPQFILPNVEAVPTGIESHLDSLKKKVEGYIGLTFSYRFYNDKNNHNAFASHADTLYLGLGLVKECLSKEEGLLCLDFIFCHEAAHLFQFSDRNNKLKIASKNIKKFELQADCLSSKIIYDCLELRDTKKFKNMLNYVFEIGDYFVNKYNHHGIPFERLISCFVYWNIHSDHNTIIDFYNKSYYLFTEAKCDSCHPISHNIISVNTKKGKKEYSIGFDMNLYESMAEGGFGNKQKTFGKIVPTANSSQESFVFKIKNRCFLLSPKYYYIRKSLIYEDQNYSILIGALNPSN